MIIDFINSHHWVSLFIFVALIICAILVNKFIIVKLPLKIKRTLQVIGGTAAVIVLGFSLFSIFFLNSNSNIDSITELSDNTTSSQWQVDFMDYNELHKYSTGENTVIALIDSGISEFQSSTINKNVKESIDDSIYDVNGHGTMMYSLLSGYENEILGISPNAQINSYKVVDKTGVINGDVLANAIISAHKDDVDIINISLGSFHSNPKVKKAIDDAVNDGIIVIASSGDYAANDMLFPANQENVISVGAIDEHKKVWNQSNAYESCDILAPGVDILTLDANKKIFNSTGTSQATALISGYVSLILSYAKEKGCNIDYCDILEKVHRISKCESTYLYELVNI